MACAGELGAAGNHVIACAGAAFPGTGSAASAGAANAKSAAVRMAEPSRKPLQRTGVSDWPIVVGSACVRDRAAVLDVIADLQSGVGEAGDLVAVYDDAEKARFLIGYKPHAIA
jgi:hypothetical protein